MHELSIALSIVDIAEEEVKKAAGTRVTQIVLEIGQLAGVEEEALDFAWQEAIKNTVLAQAERITETTAGQANCLSCDHQFGLSNLYDACPGCQSFRKEIVKGKEIRIKNLTIT